MPRPISLTIHCDALAHNLQLARARVHGQAAGVWAVVKGNAYGHGLARAMRGFAEADGLALMDLGDAEQLRSWGWDKPILLLAGAFGPDDMRQVRALDLELVVHSEPQLDWLQAVPANACLSVYLKVNTGMNRLGFAPAATHSAYQRLSAMAGVGQLNLMTHLANSSVSDSASPALTVQTQMARFDAATQGLAGQRCVLDSALFHLDTSLVAQRVRPGILLYGASVAHGVQGDAWGLLPGMTFSSEIIALQRLEAGESVGYGSRFTALHPMVIGVVACGFSDGYPRAAPDGTPVLVDGHRTGLVGRVSMESLAVDLTDLPQAGVGSPVVLWGRGLPIEQVAQAVGSIASDLMCGVSHRVPVSETAAAWHSTTEEGMT